MKNKKETDPTTEKERATRSDASKAPVGLYLACGSQRIGISKSVGCRSEGQPGLEPKTYKVLIAESLLP